MSLWTVHVERFTPWAGTVCDCSSPVVGMGLVKVGMKPNRLSRFTHPPAEEVPWLLADFLDTKHPLQRFLSCTISKGKRDLNTYAATFVSRLLAFKSLLVFPYETV
jgi:hypothetical protein